MRLKKIANYFAVIMIFLITNPAVSQDNLNSSVSYNTPLSEENQGTVNNETINNKLTELDRSYKQALESGNELKAAEIRSEIYKIIPVEKIYRTINSSREVKIISQPEIPETDWTSGNQLISYGYVNSAAGF